MHSIKPIQKRTQTGFSLIELLIAMLIGSLVMSGVFQVFLSSKKSSRVLEAESELQENARFAFSMMTSIIQEAGNFGCQTSTVSANSSLLRDIDDTFRPWRVIEGWEAANTAYGDQYKTKLNSTVSKTSSQHWTTSADAEIDTGTKSKRNSDIFKVWYTKSQRTTLNAPISVDGIVTFSEIDLEKGDIIVINDCQIVSFAQVCSCEDDDCENTDTQADISPSACNTPGNNDFDFSNLNEDTAELGVLEEAIFFVGKRSNDRKNIPSLYVRKLGREAKPGNKEEIMEGVESLQVLYGEDTNNDKSPDYYISADAVSNWSQVVSIKVSLLLRSQKNNLINGAQKLSFNGADIVFDKDDRYLRRVFTSTISLRNRNIGY